MGQVEKSAASVEEAIEAALTELGISEQEAQVEIMQEPRGGFLGLGSQAAVVRVRRAETGPGGIDELSEEARQEQADLAADFLEGLFEAMALDVDIEISEHEGGVYVDVWGPDTPEGMGILIGRHGQTLDALQDLMKTFVLRRRDEWTTVVVDVEDYRKRRRSQVLRAARDVGRRVQKSGKPEALEPMSAFERKMVHDAVGQMGGLETASEGEEPNRRVVIRRTS